MASQQPQAGAGAGGGVEQSSLTDVDITARSPAGVDLEDPKGAPGLSLEDGKEAGAAGGADGRSPPSRTSPRGGSDRPPEGIMGNPMEGVGEDEKAYNYICNLDKINLGGPGWFNDVFKINVEVDADRTWVDTLSLSLVPRNVFRRHCPLLDTRDHITGTVTVEAPTSKSVWLTGVTVTFEEHLITVDSDAGELVGALEAQVATGQFIKGKAVFHFNLDLGLLDGHRRWPVRETYVGDLMALRHRLMVSAQRPWYTFNVYSQIPLAMECLSSAPDEDAGQDNEEGGPNHVLVISDCNGRCQFDFGVDSFNLGDMLLGVVQFTRVTTPIVAAHLLLLRAEFMYGEASEVLVAEHTILGERRDEGPLPGEGLSEEEQAQRQFMSPFVEQKDVHFVHTEEENRRMEAVMGDLEVAVEVPLDVLPLTPSHMSLTKDIAAINDEAELVGVRYYIRSEPTLSSRGVDEDSSDVSFDAEMGYARHSPPGGSGSNGVAEAVDGGDSGGGGDAEKNAEGRHEEDSLPSKTRHEPERGAQSNAGTTATAAEGTNVGHDAQVVR